MDPAEAAEHFGIPSAEAEAEEMHRLLMIGAQFDLLTTEQVFKSARKRVMNGTFDVLHVIDIAAASWTGMLEHHDPEATDADQELAEKLTELGHLTVGLTREADALRPAGELPDPRQARRRRRLRREVHQNVTLRGRDYLRAREDRRRQEGDEEAPRWVLRPRRRQHAAARLSGGLPRSLGVEADGSAAQGVRELQQQETDGGHDAD